MFSPDGTLISASAAPHFGIEIRRVTYHIHARYSPSQVVWSDMLPRRYWRSRINQKEWELEIQEIKYYIQARYSRSQVVWSDMLPRRY